MRIKLTLKSDAIPGSGTSLAGIIDRDIAYDKFGLPYIPAKRIKGILRESAEDLRLNNVDEIFGEPHQDRAGKFRISNGRLEHQEDYVTVLKSEKISQFLPPQSVLDYFTYTRTQTTIENGIAKENSLRVSRVLRKGLVFEFAVSCDEDRKNDLIDICKVTRSFGLSRTRGFGEIELLLLDQEEGDESAPNVDCETGSEKQAKISIKVENLQQLLLTSIPGKKDISNNYINGSSLLGALAWNYLMEVSANPDEKFRRLFLSEKISFGNLYPTSKDGAEHYFPSPLSVRKVKENKSSSPSSDYYDLALLEDDNRVFEDVIFKGGLPEFVTLTLNKKVNVVKNIEAHHRREANRHIAKSINDTGVFFQFEVIEQGQAFCGEIIGPENLLIELSECFPNNGEIWFGKSKTGQYGKCRISWELVDMPESSVEWKDDMDMKFIFLSDMILLNDNGFATPDVNLFVSELANKLDIDRDGLELRNLFMKTTNIGGFMGVWKMPRIQKAAIASGSIIVLKNTSGEMIEVRNIEAMKFGDRIGDGFGRVAVYENKDSEVAMPEYPEVISNPIPDIPEITHTLLNYHCKRVIKSALEVEAIKQSKKYEVNNSFIGKIMAMLNNSDTIESVDEKFEKLDSKKQEKNIGKIKKGLFLGGKENKVERAKFEDCIGQVQGPIPGEIRKIKEIESEESLFEFYKHYALAFLTQLKWNNRGRN